jgi:phage gp29-like protein
MILKEIANLPNMAKFHLTTEHTGLDRDSRTILYDGIPPAEGLYLLGGEDLEFRVARQGEVFQLLRLERDPKVAAVLQIRVNGTINRPCKVLPGGDRPNDIEAAEFVKRQLLGIEEFPQSGIIDELCSSMMSLGILAGYSISEVMWVQRGSWIEIEEIRPRSPDRFLFYQPPNGENQKTAQHWGYDIRLSTISNPWQGESLPEQKILCFTFGSRTHNPYGLGLGTRVWWSVKLKRDLMADWMRYCGTFAQPTIVGKVDIETENGRLPADEYKRLQSELMEFLRAIRNGTVGVIPENASVSLLEAARGGGEGMYTTLFDIFNKEITEVFLGNINMGERQGLSGSPAKNDETMRLEIAKSDADIFHSQVINGQIIRWLIDLNREQLGDAAYPQVWRDFSIEEDKTEIMDRLEKLHEMGFRLNIDAVRRQYGPDFEDVNLAPEALPVQFEESETNDDFDTGVDHLIPRATRRASDILQKKVDLIAAMLRRKKTLEGFRDDLFSLQEVPPPQLLEQLSNALFVAYLAGEYEARKATILEFQSPIDPYALPFDEAIAWFLGKLQLPNSGQRIKAEWAAHAFWISSITDAQLLAEMHAAVLDAISNGEGYQAFREQFKEIADRHGWMPREGISGRANVVFDANMRSAFAAGQFAQYSKPHILQAFPEWEWRHRDSPNPRPHHLAQDGKRFAASASPPFWLPSGFGCRCRFIPRRASGQKLVTVDMVQNPKGIQGELSPAITRNGQREFLADPGWGYPPSTANRQKVIDQMVAKLPPGLAKNLLNHTP